MPKLLQARESFRGRAESGRQDLARGGASGLGIAAAPRNWETEVVSEIDPV